MGEWKGYKLGDLLMSANTGLDAIKRAPIVGRDTGIKCLRIQDISQDKPLDKWGFAEVSQKNFEQFQLMQDDIIMARTCSTGIQFLVRENLPSVFNNGLVRLRADKSKVLPSYLNYHFVSPIFVGFVDSISGGTSAQLNMQIGDLLSYEFPLPSLPEQRAIAEVLSSLDEKIDLLHRQDSTLEALAEALFRRWFVEEAEESWEFGVVTDFIDLNPKRTLSKGVVAPYLEMSNLSNELYHPHDWYDREFTSGTKFVNGDALLARITPCLENGKTAYVDWLKGDEVGWGSTEFIVLRAKAPLHLFFSYILARHSDFREFAIGCMVGSSGRQRVDVENLATYEMRIPPVGVINHFNAHIETAFQMMKHNNCQIRTLTKLRDALLPKLMSGEVRVKE